ncbi:tripartite tricarboxylate transporter substrate binding protein [Roseomonas sp. PWR1]|uniref:Tripartite tricarboxylate transporter substrate binding protein n=1 Tax=Roseomonas nitratireducens TaxID=2820810 RepID=A0ABS4ARX8_9PROT|nr:tripartite tricarboxylate transporter substrate binding protein [Neoroseomonas nitratireducens]MBP0464110.1 tripartite tricarboxylate transporter substrate binding protein [Neoroseomonas nitratireducens]
MRRLFLPLIAAFACLIAAQPASAQSWPTRPIRVVVVFPPGGSSDIVARVLADALTARLNQRVVVDNRPGAGGTLGAAHVAQQPADGYTLMLSNTAPITSSPPIYPTAGYDPVGGFTHIAYIGATPLVVVANRNIVPATDLRGLIDWARAQRTPPGFGSSGAGSVAHIAGAMFERQTGVALTHVPYRGSAPMQADLLGGTIPIAFDTLPQNLDHIREGRLRAFAVTARAREPMAPEVPTVAEAGLSDLLVENWLGLSGPAGLPAPVVARLHEETLAAMATPEMRRRLDEHGIRHRAMSQPDFAAFVAQDVREIGGLVRSLGISVQ